LNRKAMRRSSPSTATPGVRGGRLMLAAGDNGAHGGRTIGEAAPCSKRAMQRGVPELCAGQSKREVVEELRRCLQGRRERRKKGRVMQLGPEEPMGSAREVASQVGKSCAMRILCPPEIEGTLVRPGCRLCCVQSARCGGRTRVRQAQGEKQSFCFDLPGWHATRLTPG